jgi:hypothetical protein
MPEATPRFYAESEVGALKSITFAWRSLRIHVLNIRLRRQATAKSHTFRRYIAARRTLPPCRKISQVLPPNPASDCVFKCSRPILYARRI